MGRVVVSSGVLRLGVNGKSSRPTVYVGSMFKDRKYLTDCLTEMAAAAAAVASFVNQTFWLIVYWSFSPFCSHRI